MSGAQLPSPRPHGVAWRPRGRGWLIGRRLQTVAGPRADAAHVTRIRLWLPLTPLWILLAPFALLLSPALAAAPAARGVNPLRAAFAIGALLMSLAGTVVEVDAPGASIKIRIF
jgi:hypothetical protein